MVVGAFELTLDSAVAHVLANTWKLFIQPNFSRYLTFKVTSTLDGKQRYVTTLGEFVLNAHAEKVPKAARVVRVSPHVLDYRRSNLVCISQSCMTQRRAKACGASSRFIGVSYSQEARLWVASLTTQGSKVYLGKYRSEVEAASAYDAALFDREGELANTNRRRGLLSP